MKTLRLDFSIERCHILADYCLGQCLDNESKGCDYKYSWFCGKCGFEWKSLYYDIRNGHWCPKCAGCAKHCIDDCHIVAELRGGQCDSNKYISSDTKYSWWCGDCHYKWQTSYTNVRRGRWCPKCSGHQKLCIDNCHILAESKKGQCKSNVFVDSKTKYIWECYVGHKWSATYSSIQNGGWCPYCVGQIKHTIQECHLFAENKCGKCLETVYIDNKTPMGWECEKEHRWWASFGHIKNRNSWCPKCGDGKTQNKTKHILEDIFNIEFLSNYTNLWWLKTYKKISQEIDFYSPELKIGGEYDGEQHFFPVCFNGMSYEKAVDSHKRTIELDQLKNEKIKNHPEDVKYFIRISYKEPVTKEYILYKLVDAGVPIFYLISGMSTFK